MGVYKSLSISIVTVMKNPEMFKFLPHRLRAKKCISQKRMQLKNRS